MEQSLAALRRLAASSYGPAGRSKVLRANANSNGTLVTSISHRLFGALHVEHPAMRVLLESLQQRQSADGGLFTVLLATELLLSVIASGEHGRRIAALLPQVGDRAAAYVLKPSGHASVALRLSDLNALLALVHGATAANYPACAPHAASRTRVASCAGVLSTKRVALPSLKDGVQGGEVRHLALLIVSAFVQCAAAVAVVYTAHLIADAPRAAQVGRSPR
jgi:hypothetical protein